MPMDSHIIDTIREDLKTDGFAQAILAQIYPSRESCSQSQLAMGPVRFGFLALKPNRTEPNQFLFLKTKPNRLKILKPFKPNH